MIIWIASYPKSGNTWLRTIISQLIFDKKNQDDKWLLDINNHIDLYPKLKHFNKGCIYTYIINIIVINL